MAEQAQRDSIYLRLARELRAAILRQDFPEGVRLPTEAELADRYGISRQTVRRAFQDLVAEGLVHRVPGRGTFATPREEQYLRQFGSVDDLMGLSLDTRMDVVTPVAPAGRRRRGGPAAACTPTGCTRSPSSGCTRTPRSATRRSRCRRTSADCWSPPRNWRTPARAGATTVIGLLDERLPEPIAEAEQSITVAAAGAEIAGHLGCEPGRVAAAHRPGLPVGRRPARGAGRQPLPARALLVSRAAAAQRTLTRVFPLRKSQEQERALSLRIVVTVKYVPDATGDRHFADDLTIDRDDVDGLLSELDEYAVEQALQISENSDDDVEVTVLTVGPEDAKDALRKALSMGADKAIHVEDDDLHGTDAIGTSLVLAKAIEKAGYDLVVSGMASTDGTMGVVPALLAERLGVPQVTLLSEVTVEDGAVKGRRDGDAASEQLEASLPAVVSVTDQSGEARYPSFKGIMAAKKKPVQAWDLSDLDIEADEVGLAGRVDHGRLRRPASGPYRGHDRQGRGRGRQAARRVPGEPEVHLRAPGLLRLNPLTAPQTSQSAGEHSHG